jgi:signal transduction histidine kinase/Tfp pilus assembly protein PilF
VISVIGKKICLENLPGSLPARKGFILFIIFLFVSGLGFAQKSVVDSLKTALATSADENKIATYQALIQKFWLNQTDTAMHYAMQAVDFASSRSAKEKATAYRLKGAVYFYMDQYDSCIKYNIKAFSFSVEAKDSLLIANSANNAGLAYFEVGDYTKALEYLLKCIQIKYKIKTKSNIERTYNNVGLIYNELKQYEKARQYFNQALAISKNLKDTVGWMYALNNLGLTCLNEKKLAEAESYLQTAEILAFNIDNAVDEAATLCGLGRVALERGEIYRAKNYLKRSLKIREGLNGLAGMAEVYYYFGEIYRKSNHSDSSIYSLRKSVSLASKVRSRDILILCYRAFSQLYLERKSFDSAFFYQSNFIRLRDSLFNENTARNINDIQLQIHDAETRPKLSQKDREISSRTYRIYIVTAFALAIVVPAIGFYRSRNRERKLKDDLAKEINQIERQKSELQLNHERLAEVHELISQQKSELITYNNQLQTTVDARTQELEVTNRELKAVNLGLDNFISKSAGDLKGPLEKMIGVCHVALLDCSDPTAKLYLTKLSENAKTLNEIFDRLRTVSSINSLQPSREKIDFNEMILKTKGKLKLLDGFSEIVFKEEIEKINFQCDPVLLETIFHNLLENAVKFQKKSTQFNKFIAISVKSKSGSIHISFVDNGIGIGKTDDTKLFTMFTNAALEHKTIGLGLYIVKQCTAKLNGTVRIVPNTQQYTEFELTLPVEAA